MQAQINESDNNRPEGFDEFAFLIVGEIGIIEVGPKQVPIDRQGQRLQALFNSWIGLVSHLLSPSLTGPRIERRGCCNSPFSSFTMKEHIVNILRYKSYFTKKNFHEVRFFLRGFVPT